jgi:hypothetical protein
MGLGTTPRPHHITWDYRAGYRASRHHAADTTHFLSSVSHQARKRDRIAHPEPIRTRQSGHPACRPGRDRGGAPPASVPPFPFVSSCHLRTTSGVISAVDPDVAMESGDHRPPDQPRSRFHHGGACPGCDPGAPAFPGHSRGHPATPPARPDQAAAAGPIVECRNPPYQGCRPRGSEPDGEADRERDAERQLQPPRLAERPDQRGTRRTGPNRPYRYPR